MWHSTSVPGGPRTAWGGHIFQPLRFRGDGSVEELDCSADARFNVRFPLGNEGTGGEEGEAAVAIDGSAVDAVVSVYLAP